MDGASVDSGSVHVDQHERNAAVLVVPVGTDGGQTFIGPLAATGSRFLPIDKITVAGVLGIGL